MEGRPYEELHEFCDFSLAEQNEAAAAKGVAAAAPADFQPVVKKSVCYIVAAVIFNEHNEVEIPSSQNLHRPAAARIVHLLTAAGCVDAVAEFVVDYECEFFLHCCGSLANIAIPLVGLTGRSKREAGTMLVEPSLLHTRNTSR